MTIDIRDQPYNSPCNGVDDDTPALNAAAIAAAQTGDEVFLYGSLVGSINYSGAAPLSIRGSGPLSCTLRPIGQTPAITIQSAAALNLSNLGISYGANGAGVTAITIDGPPSQPAQANSESALNNVRIIGAFHGLQLIRAAWYRINALTVLGYNGNAVAVDDLANIDAGDGVIDSLLAIAAAKTGTGIFQTGGSGLRVSKAKILGGLTGFQQYMRGGTGTTCDTFIEGGCSFEGQSLANIYVSPQNGATSKSLIITGCELAGAPTGINVQLAPGPNPCWLKNVVVCTNTIDLPGGPQGPFTAMSFAGVDTLTVRDNAVSVYPGYEPHSWGLLIAGNVIRGKYSLVPSTFLTNMDVQNSSNGVSAY